MTGNGKDEALPYFFLMYLGGDSDLKAQEPQDLRPLLHGLQECKECDQVFPDVQRWVNSRYAQKQICSRTWYWSDLSS